MSAPAIFYLTLYLLSVIGTRLGLYKLFEKAGEDKWKAFVPVVSDMIWVKLIGKPQWWVAMCFLPAARTLVKVQMRIDLAKGFNRNAWWEHAAAAILPFIYFPYIGFQPTGSLPSAENNESPRKRGGLPAKPNGVVFITPEQHKAFYPEPVSGGREWYDAILYAGTAAVIIRTLYFEAFVIPTTSMERTLMAGDFLFVSKFHYGCRMPMVPFALPFVHNQLPVVGGKSYLAPFELPYFRLPGLTSIKRNDIVVFNYPAHDIDNSGIIPYGTIDEPSMKENYIKRCVGMPGDVLEVKMGQLFINGSPAQRPEFQQSSYCVDAPLAPLLMDKQGFRVFNPEKPDQNADCLYDPNRTGCATGYGLWCTPAMAEKVKSLPDVKGVTEQIAPAEVREEGIYPSGITREGLVLEHNNRDNFGPLKLPKQGEAIPLTEKNYRLYIRCIKNYEKRDFAYKGGKFYIDGKETTQYVPNMNYYFMMGDNRHNSGDSRYWGFVPENHIVGTPIFIFFSTENITNPSKWRLSRIGTSCVK